MQIEARTHHNLLPREWKLHTRENLIYNPRVLQGVAWALADDKWMMTHVVDSVWRYRCILSRKHNSDLGATDLRTYEEAHAMTSSCTWARHGSLTQLGWNILVHASGIFQGCPNYAMRQNLHIDVQKHLFAGLLLFTYDGDVTDFFYREGAGPVARRKCLIWRHACEPDASA